MAENDIATFDAFVSWCRINGVPVDPDGLSHRLGGGPVTPETLLRAAQAMGLKARVVRAAFVRLAGLPLPAVGVQRDGGFLLVARAAEDRVLVQEAGAAGPRVLDRAAFEAVWDGRLVLLARRASLGDLARRFDVSWFLQAMGKYRHLLGEVLLASFVLQLIALVTPIFFQVVIDKVLVHRGLSTLDVLAIGLLAVTLFETLLTVLRTWLLAHTTTRIDVELGARVFRHLLALPMAYFNARRTGDSVARVRELEHIREFLTGQALTIVLDLVFCLVFVAIMVWYAPLLALVVVGAFPLYVLVSVVVTPLFRRRLDEKFARGAENQAFLVESVSGAETLKAMAVEPQMQRRWEEQLAAYVGASFKVVSLANVASNAIQLVSKLVTIGVLYFGALLVIDNSLSVGELVAFNMFAQRVAQPVLRLAQLWQDFQQTRISVDRLGDILNTPPEPQFTPGRMAPPPIRGEVVLEHVTFRYRTDGPEVLSDVSLRIAAGEVIGIVGPSGSGKSTVTRLVQRLHAPVAGRVLIDGLDLAQVETAWLRRQIGVVLQENVLFDGSVRSNIALADPGMPMERVVAAARLAGAHEFVLELPDAYDTHVGERGVGLSGGQRQRIAIARALATDPRLLIFDEATSALDYESERVIQTNMREICRGRTVIVIAHRLSAVRHADRIVTIERGRVVEAGSHDELLRTGGRYAALWRLQGGEP